MKFDKSRIDKLVKVEDLPNLFSSIVKGQEMQAKALQESIDSMNNTIQTISRMAMESKDKNERNILAEEIRSLNHNMARVINAKNDINSIIAPINAIASAIQGLNNDDIVKEIGNLTKTIKDNKVKQYDFEVMRDVQGRIDKLVAKPR